MQFASLSFLGIFLAHAERSARQWYMRPQLHHIYWTHSVLYISQKNTQAVWINIRSRLSSQNARSELWTYGRQSCLNPRWRLRPVCNHRKTMLHIFLIPLNLSLVINRLSQQLLTKNHSYIVYYSQMCSQSSLILYHIYQYSSNYLQRIIINS